MQASFNLLSAKVELFEKKYGDILEANLQDREWWKNTISEAKRKFIVWGLGVIFATMGIGFLFGVLYYLSPIFSIKLPT